METVKASYEYEYKRFLVRSPDGHEGRLPPRAFSKTVRATVRALKATGYAGCLSKAVLKTLQAPQV